MENIPNLFIMEKYMAYEKPQVIAQNNASGSYAAGCPTEGTGNFHCKECERSQ